MRGLLLGVKHRSGRKPDFNKQRTIDEVVNLSIHTVACYLASDKVSMRDKVEIASRFALKRVPDLSLVQVSVGMDERQRSEMLAELRRGLITQTEEPLVVYNASDTEPSSTPNTPEPIITEQVSNDGSTNTGVDAESQPK